MTEKSILIAGGYGVVGSEIARMFRRLYPDVHLVLAGRSKEKAEKLAEELGNAEGLAVDLSAPTLSLPDHIKPDALLSAVTNRNLSLLKYAIKNDMGYIDFAISGQHLTDGITTTLHSAPSKGIAFVSNWMAGVPAILAKQLASRFDQVADVDMDILYYGDDKGGPDTAGAVEEFAAPFTGWRNGDWQQLKPMRDAKTMTFPSGLTRKVQLINMPDVSSLAYATDAQNVNVRLGLDNPMDTFLSALIVRSGIWHLLPHKTKEQILYNPGDGAIHEVIVTVRGQKNGQFAEESLSLLDPLGQTHMTALGACHAVERVLGLDGQPPLRPGPSQAEAVGDPERLRHLLDLEGIQLTE